MNLEERNARIQECWKNIEKACDEMIDTMSAGSSTAEKIEMHKKEIHEIVETMISENK